MAEKIELTKEQMKEMTYLYRVENMHLEDIGDKFGVSREWVRKRMINVSKLFDDKDWLYEKHCIEKLQLVEIADIANTSFDTISRRMREFEIPVDVNIRRPTKYSYNQNYFSEIDSSDKAYWLGFINADGGIEYEQEKSSSSTIRLKIHLAKKDINHLHKFLDDIESNVPVKTGKTYLKATDKYYDYARVVLYSKKICDDLIDQKIKVNKSTNEQPPLITDKELIRHYIRGYFDGDGSFNYWYSEFHNKWNCSFNVIGSREIVEYISNFIEQELGISSNVRKNGEIYRIDISNGYAEEIMFWLYKESIRFLERKNQTFSDWLNLKSTLILEDIV